MTTQKETMLEKSDKSRKRVHVRETEEWQRKHWGKRMFIDSCRPEIVEVMANRKTFLSKAGIRKPGILIYLMESIRAGIHNHDWLLVSKCVEGLAEEFKKQSSGVYWILWNGGFLAIANIYKNDVNKILNFARLARPVLRCYPRRLGIEVATWMSQKGFVNMGMELMEELYTNTCPESMQVYNGAVNLENPKRRQIELIYTLIKAAYCYSCWKRDMSLLKQGLYTEDRMSVRRVGEMALVQFDIVLDWAEKADADVTIFIKPYIELIMEFRTEFAARELFLRLVEKNDRNFILEGLYLNFIEQYFPFLEEEVEYFQECRKRYKFIKRDNQLALFKFRNWRDGLLKKKQDLPLQPKKLPTYSF